MRPKKLRKPFTLYRKETRAGPVWYARFWDEISRRYATARSTGVPVEGKKQHRYEAEQAARSLLTTLKHSEVKDSPKVFADTPFIQYLYAFWSPGSEYVREAAAVRKEPLSAAYIKNNVSNIRLHIEPFPGAVPAPGVKGAPAFCSLTLGGLTGDIIRSWMLWLGEKAVSGRRVNQCLQTIRVAVRDALERGRLETDPFKRIHEAPEEGREKGVLSPAEATRYIASNSQDCYARLCILLGMLCGMRRGEIRGFQWGDIREGVIVIRHNFVNGDGLKNPKRKGGMVRENSRAVPLPRAVAEALTAVYQRAQYREPGDYVIQSLRRRNKPVSESYFKYALLREMDGIGISPEEQKERNITPHSLRHTFIAKHLV